MEHQPVDATGSREHGNFELRLLLITTGGAAGFDRGWKCFSILLLIIYGIIKHERIHGSHHNLFFFFFFLAKKKHLVARFWCVPWERERPLRIEKHAGR